MEVCAYNSTIIILYQKKFATEMIEEAQLTGSKNCVTPLPLNFKFSIDSDSTLHDPSVYRSMIGKLNYMTNTEPDISFVVQVLSQFMQKPNKSHYLGLLHILRYVKGTSHYGLIFQPGNNISLHVFVDCDHVLLQEGQ